MAVALRKESVDRNKKLRICALLRLLSLSARRAWIEILFRHPDGYQHIVALRKESVDRNVDGVVFHGKDLRRSPQGERG